MPCGITSERTLTITQISTKVNLDMTKYWFHWIIKNVNNPTKYNPSDTFTLLYQVGETIAWKISKKLVYFISEPPQLMKMVQINVTDSNIKSAAIYNFTVKKPTGTFD